MSMGRYIRSIYQTNFLSNIILEKPSNCLCHVYSGGFLPVECSRRGKIIRQQQSKICHDYARNFRINLANKKATSLENYRD